MNDYLEKVKRRLAINDVLQDDQLEIIIDNVMSELKMRTSLNVIPNNLEFIVVEVATKRFNRIGAEGMSSESVEGRSSTYEQKDFEPYQSLLDYLYPKDSRRKGSINFY
ncbi:phage head-tail connector protein [Mammaliicoccus sciuri]|uniref:phage head-tail connector protein n=1 Tax=Mammaliicoccus sciuri TaxID=1296 RepID=UPI0036E746EA